MAGEQFRKKNGISTGTRVGMCMSLGENEIGRLRWSKRMVGHDRKVIDSFDLKLKCLSYKEITFEQRHKNESK